MKKILSIIGRIDAFSQDAVAQAMALNRDGASEILLSYDGKKENRKAFLERIQQVSAKVPAVCAEGGLFSLEDVEAVVDAGARSVCIGTEALTNSEVVRRASYKLGREFVAVLVTFSAEEPNFPVKDGKGRVLIPWLQELEKLGAGLLILQTDKAGRGEMLSALKAAQETVSIPVMIVGDSIDYFKAVEMGADGLLFANTPISDVIPFLQENCFSVMEERADLSAIRFGKDGLIPAIAQDIRTGQVLMQAYMNEEALRETLRTGEAVYYSRSRNELWHKGATSGNIQKVLEIDADCDRDSLLLRVNPAGPACHTGEMTCFHNVIQAMDGGRSAAQGAGILQALYQTILDRHEHPQEGSYTNKLLSGGVDKIGKKVIEEAAETVLAAKNSSTTELRFEAADLIYHLFVLMVQQGVSPDEVYAELANRHGSKPPSK